MPYIIIEIYHSSIVISLLFILRFPFVVSDVWEIAIIDHKFL